MPTFRCPVCGMSVVIDMEKKERIIAFDGVKFPKHGDCELAKALSKIDFSKLQKV